MPPCYRIRRWSELFENNRTRDLKSLRWFSFPNTFDEDGFREIVSHPSASAVLGCWIVMLAVASRAEPRGVLIRANGEPHTPKSLEIKTGIPADDFENALLLLMSNDIKWIESIPHDPAGGCDPIEPQLGAASRALSGWKGKEGKGRESTTPLPPSEGGEAVKPKPKRRRIMPEEEPEGFQSFWGMYPRKVAKARARKVWKRESPEPEQIVTILAGLNAQLQEFRTREYSKIPHPATWLNDRRWEDEVRSANGTGPEDRSAIKRSWEQFEEARAHDD